MGSDPTAGIITVVDTLPAGLVPTAAVGPGWSCSIAGQTVTCTHPGPLPPVSSLPQIIISFTTDSTMQNGSFNCATVDTNGDVNPQNDESCVDFGIEQPTGKVDLSITKKGSASYMAGGTGTFTLTISNMGSDPTTGIITVVDTLPAGLVPTAAVGPGWSCSIAGQTVTCTHPGPLPPVSSLPQIIISFMTDSTMQNGSFNCATVDTNGDVNPQNDESCVDFGIDQPTGKVDLSITKKGSASYTAGGTGTFTLTIDNVSSSPTTGLITVVDTLPTGLTPTAAAGPGWACTIAGQTVTCTHPGPLPPVSSLPQIIITFTADSTMQGGSFNCADVSTPGDFNPQNDHSCVDFGLVPPTGGCVQPPSGMVGWWAGDSSALDISGWSNHGTPQNGALYGPGMVLNGFALDGTNDHVRVNHHPSLNMGIGDFSIDAWVTYDQLSGKESPIVSKWRGKRGYYFFIIDGTLGLVLGNSGGYSIYTGGSVPVGVPTFVAVTVERNAPTGVQFYVNGSTFPGGDPTVRSSTLNNGRPVYLGKSDYSAFGGAVAAHFDGTLDEVEIFRRALAPAELLSIFNARESGKCKDTIQVPWDQPICKNQNMRKVKVSFCNHSGASYTYDIPSSGAVTGLGTGAHPGCSVNFTNPTTYTVLDPPVTLAPNTCGSMFIKLTKPPTMAAAGNIACYRVDVTNQGTGNVFSDDGSLVQLNKWCFDEVVADTPFDPIDMPVGPIRPFSFTMTNTQEVSSSLSISIAVVPSNMQGTNRHVSLNGRAPGKPFTQEVRVAAGATATVSTDVFFDVFVEGPVAASTENAQKGILRAEEPFETFDPFRFYDVVLSADLGDGRMTPVYSVGVRSGVAPDVPETETGGHRVLLPLIVR